MAATRASSLKRRRRAGAIGLGIIVVTPAIVGIGLTFHAHHGQGLPRSAQLISMKARLYPANLAGVHGATTKSIPTSTSTPASVVTPGPMPVSVPVPIPTSSSSPTPMTTPTPKPVATPSLTPVATPTPTPTPPFANGLSIDAGGAGSGAFIADAYYTPSSTDALPSGVLCNPNFPPTVAHPIPTAAWNTSRYLATDYTIPGFTAGGTYQVRLYFMDWYFQHPGQRQFNVDINGVPVLTNFDIIATAVAAGADGQEAFGVERDFTATADATGAIAINFFQGAVNQPRINAIAIVPSR